MSMMVRGICSLNESIGELEDDGDEKVKFMRFRVDRSVGEDHIR